MKLKRPKECSKQWYPNQNSYAENNGEPISFYLQDQHLNSSNKAPIPIEPEKQQAYIIQFLV